MICFNCDGIKFVDSFVYKKALQCVKCLVHSINCGAITVQNVDYTKISKTVIEDLTKSDEEDIL